MFQIESLPIQIFINQKEVPSESIPWTPHISFKGVALKHLITAKDTAGLASLHWVKVDPGCALLEHSHPGKWELHEVVLGRAIAVINQEKIIYAPGTLALIPADAPHSVVAGPEGLLLKATFFPALL